MDDRSLGQYAAAAEPCRSHDKMRKRSIIGCAIAVATLVALGWWEYTPPHKWEAVQYGMSKTSVESLLGKPSCTSEGGLNYWLRWRVIGCWQLAVAYRYDGVMIRETDHCLFGPKW